MFPPVADVVFEVTAAGGEVGLVFFLVVDLGYGGEGLGLDVVVGFFY